jgi:hypothetical protein
MKNEKVRRIILYSLAGVIVVVMGIMLFRSASVVFAAGNITLDGSFNDWSGQACISDPVGDAVDPGLDLIQFCFATNSGVSNAYFMMQREGTHGAKEMNMQLLVDTNNNGSYSDAQDVVVSINYKPTGSSGTVTVSFGFWSMGIEQERRGKPCRMVCALFSDGHRTRANHPHDPAECRWFCCRFNR